MFFRIRRLRSARQGGIIAGRVKYKYLYQTKDNENREGWIVAANRAEAYAALRRQGIRPYRVIGDDPVRWQPWAAGAAIAALAAALACALAFGGGDADGFPTRRRQITGDGAVISKGLESCWDGVFSTKLDRFLAAYAQPGWIAIPPDVSAEDVAHFADDLAMPPETRAEDSGEVRQLRRIVAAMRRELSEYLAAGGTVEEYMSFLEDRQDEEIAFRKQALESVETAPAAMRGRVLMNMNVRLREMGLAELGE